MMIDFDDIDDWANKLTAALCQHVPESARQQIAEAKPQYIEDAQDLLFALTDREAVIDSTLLWLQSREIAGYHGSRLTDTETLSIQESGLQPLDANVRRVRLIRALSFHPKWPEVSAQLDAAIQSHGQGNFAGRREGQVHLTLSRAGLTNKFAHYLTHGSEFDQHIASQLLGSEGLELLARDGNAKVIRFAVPANFVLNAVHRFWDIDDVRARGEVPRLVDEFLKSWSYRLAYSGFQTRTLRVDCGMVFRQVVPPEWIVGFDTL